TENATQLVSGLLGMVGVAAFMVWLNPRLALIALVVIPAMSLALNRWVARRTREGFRQQQQELGALNGLIEETVAGQRVVKAFHREPVAIAEFDLANRRVREAATRAQIFAAYTGPMMNLVGNLGLAIVAGAGGWMAILGLATLGTIAS